MDKEEMISKLNSVKLCMMAHPDYKEGSEFEDRIKDISEIIHELKKDYL